METWEQLLAAAQVAAKAARDIFEKAVTEKREMTEAERTEYQAQFDLAAAKKAESDRVKADVGAMAVLAGIAAENGTAPDAGTQVKVGVQGRRSFGEIFTKSEPYVVFQKAHPSGVGAGSPISIGRVKVGTLADWYVNRKALLVSDIAEIPNIRMPLVDQVVAPRLTLLDLISRGSTGGNFEYIQVTAVTRNAAIVPEATAADDDDALKPVSDMSTELADAKVYTYADGYDVTNQLLADAPAFASYMNTQLGISLDNVLEEKVLNGPGGSGEPTGLAFTTGVQEQEYTGSDPMDLVKAIRKGITKVTTVNGSVTGIVMSPEDDENIDLMQDLNERFYGQGPFGSGPQTLWGRPRVVCDRIPQGTVWLGEWAQIALLDREGLSILAFNQHKDYAQRNLTYVRGELRAAQVNWMPVRFCVVTAGS